MDSSGRVYDVPAGQEKIAKMLGLTPIRRDLSAKEKMTRQLELYAPCGCGSGRKFKFCCRGKTRAAEISLHETVG